MNTKSLPASLWRDREIWIFLVLIVIANSAFVYVIAEGLLSQRYYWQGRFLLLGLILVVVAFAFRGFKAVWALITPVLHWRVHPGWYLLALFAPPIVCAVSLLGVGWYQGVGTALLTVSLDTVTNPAVYPAMLLSAFVGEIVWVGYSIARIKRHTSPLVASLIVGLFWSAWWVPVVLIGLGVVQGMSIPALFVHLVGVAILCGFVYAHTGSGLVVLIMQLCFNSTLISFPATPESAGGLLAFWTFITVYFLVALALFFRFGPKPLWHHASAGHGDGTPDAVGGSDERSPSPARARGIQ